MDKEKTIEAIEDYLRTVKKAGKYNWYRTAAKDIYALLEADSPFPSSREIVRKAMNHYSNEKTGFMSGAKYVIDYMVKQGKSDSYH
jgi:hypothetical protein